MNAVMNMLPAIPMEGQSPEVFRQTRIDRIADYLRARIQRGELSSPLPSTRALSEKLGIGRASLEQSLKILEAEGLVRIRPRKGILLVSSPAQPNSVPAVRTIRWVWHKKTLAVTPVLKEIFFSTSERLRASGINSVFENGSINNIKAIQREGPKKHELLFLVSIDPQLQCLFSNFDRNALLIGLPEPGVNLPYVSVDIFSALRHAINSSITKGFEEIALLVSGYVPSELKTGFDTVCKKRAKPIRGQLVQIPNSLKEQVTSIVRFARTLHGPTAVILLSPVSPSLFVTALQKHRPQLLDTIEVIAFNADQQAINIIPFPTYYPYPVEKLTRALCRVAIHYFDQGTISGTQQLIHLERHSLSGGGAA